jgi:hypothetical protein
MISLKSGSRRVMVREMTVTPSTGISALFLPPKREARPPARMAADISGNAFIRIIR